VSVRDGFYSAYGQKLVIERGRAVFNGPIDNPLLDIVAMRPNLPVQAGVTVTGTVLSPSVRLTSRPDMSDAERLSWLVLGVAPEGAQTGAQTAALQAAAASLFGRNDGGLAASLGLDVLTVRAAGTGSVDPLAGALTPGSFGAGGVVPGQVGSSPTVAASAASQNVVAIGKRLSSKVVVTYEQGLRGIWNLLRIQYELTDRLSVRAQTGSESAIDLLWRLSFD
jgi:translocation and assembly module TamB